MPQVIKLNGEMSKNPQLGKELQNEDIIPQNDLTKIDDDISVDELVDKANALIDQQRHKATLSASGSNASSPLKELPPHVEKIKDDFLKQLATTSSPSEPDTQEWKAAINLNFPDIEEHLADNVVATQHAPLIDEDEVEEELPQKVQRISKGVSSNCLQSLLQTTLIVAEFAIECCDDINDSEHTVNDNEEDVNKNEILAKLKKIHILTMEMSSLMTPYQDIASKHQTILMFLKMSKEDTNI